MTSTTVSAAISEAVQRARSGPVDLSNRLDSEAAVTTRHASRAVRDLLARQWNPDGLTWCRRDHMTCCGCRDRMRCPGDAPPWVRRGLGAAPWVVVRRAAAPTGQVAVGVRGANRSERYGTEVDLDDVREVVAPEDLAHIAPASRVGGDVDTASCPPTGGRHRVAVGADGKCRLRTGHRNPHGDTRKRPRSAGPGAARVGGGVGAARGVARRVRLSRRAGGLSGRNLRWRGRVG